MKEIYRGGRKAYVVSQQGAFYLPKFLVSKANRLTPMGSMVVNLLAKSERSKKKKELSVAYMPGFACNLSCEYCYQRTDSDDIRKKPSLQDLNTGSAQIIKFIQDEAHKRGLSDVSLTLLGGEPLVYLSHLSNFIKDLDSVMHLTSLELITNGTLLTPEFVQELSPQIPLSVQVTFDGNEDEHNRYRFFGDKTGSYQQIISNLQRSQDFLESISIRVNLSPESVLSAKNLIDDLLKTMTMKKLNFSLVPIDDTVHYKGRTSWTEEIFKSYYDLALHVLASGASLSPPGHSGFCGTCGIPGKPGGLVITANGNLYSCWDSAGQKGYEVGNVLTGFKYENNHAWVRCGYGSSDEGNIKNRLLLECIKALEDSYETF